MDISEPYLRLMYQQWQQGNNDYVSRWKDFASMAASASGMSVEIMSHLLQQFQWFKTNV